MDILIFVGVWAALMALLIGVVHLDQRAAYRKGREDECVARRLEGR